MLDGVSTFSAKNNMVFVHGMDDENILEEPRSTITMDPLPVRDENRLRKEF